MTSKERKEQRYIRRQIKRQKNKKAHFEQDDNFDWVFSYEHLYESYNQFGNGRVVRVGRDLLVIRFDSGEMKSFDIALCAANKIFTIL